MEERTRIVSPWYLSVYTSLPTQYAKYNKEEEEKKNSGRVTWMLD
jgi:hypothetical protein